MIRVRNTALHKYWFQIQLHHNSIRSEQQSSIGPDFGFFSNIFYLSLSRFRLPIVSGTGWRRCIILISMLQYSIPPAIQSLSKNGLLFSLHEILLPGNDDEAGLLKKPFFPHQIFFWCI